MCIPPLVRVGVPNVEAVDAQARLLLPSVAAGVTKVEVVGSGVVAQMAGICNEEWLAEVEVNLKSGE